MNMPRLTCIVATLTAVGTVAIGSIVLIARSPTPSSAPLVPARDTADSDDERAPTLTWSVASLELILSPGETASRTVTLTINRNIDVRLCASSTLSPFVRIKPLTTRANENDDEDNEATNDTDDEHNDKVCSGGEVELKRGQPQSVELMFSIPAGTALGAYDGRIEILRRRKILSEPLNIAIKVWPQLTSPDVPFTLKYPSGWSVFDLGSASPTLGFLPPLELPDASDEYVGDIVAELHSNPSQLDLTQFYATTALVNLLANSRSFASLEINGLPALQFIDVSGMIPTNVISINKGQFVIEITDVGQQHDVDGIFELLAHTVK